VGNLAGFRPVLVMDVWERAFLLDYKPAERPKYIEAFSRTLTGPLSKGASSTSLDPGCSSKGISPKGGVSRNSLRTAGTG
jgi:hypothetical protein